MVGVGWRVQCVALRGWAPTTTPVRRVGHIWFNTGVEVGEERGGVITGMSCRVEAGRTGRSGDMRKDAGGGGCRGRGGGGGVGRDGERRKEIKELDDAGEHVSIQIK
eukprot:750872-Hanusia_phi.AAC.1